MAGLAQILSESGHEVSGSDIQFYPPMSDYLEDTGIKTIKGYEFRRRVNGIQEKIRIEANKFNKGQISQLEYNKKVNELNEKYSKIRNKFIEDVNVPVDYQEGAELSEVIPRITGAIKKQTENIFGKN